MDFLCIGMYNPPWWLEESFSKTQRTHYPYGFTTIFL